MKKAIIWLVCIFLLFTFCACGAQNDAQRYAKKCWDLIGSNSIEVDKIYFMKYTSRAHLSDEVLDTSMYEELPKQGYVILFHSFNAPYGKRFWDSYACFLDANGNIVFTFDYEENDKLYEKYYSQFSPTNISAGEKALVYLKNCVYISGMINDANSGEDLQGTIEKNTWYSFSNKQIERATK